MLWMASPSPETPPAITSISAAARATHSPATPTTIVSVTPEAAPACSVGTTVCVPTLESDQQSP